MLPKTQKVALFGLFLALSGCAKHWEPLPAQPTAAPAADPPARPYFVSFSERRADYYIVKGIPKGLHSGWDRWTDGAPAVRFHLAEDVDLPTQAGIDFTAVEATMKDTGPITITLKANGRELGKLRVEKPDVYQMRAPLGAKLGEDVLLEAVIDKPWISPEDHAQLGVIVSAMGLLP